MYGITCLLCVLVMVCVFELKASIPCGPCSCTNETATCSGLDVKHFESFPDGIKTISIRNWHPDTLDEQVFPKLPTSVRYIYITSLSTHEIKSGAFGNFEVNRVYHFDLANVTAGRVHSDAFKDWNSVSHLNLRDWSVKHMAAGAFSNITNIDAIWFTTMNMSQFPASTFNNITFQSSPRYTLILLRTVNNWRDLYFGDVVGRCRLKIVGSTDMQVFSHRFFPPICYEMEIRENIIRFIECGAFLPNITYQTQYRDITRNKINCGTADCCLLNDDQNVYNTVMKGSNIPESLLNNFACLDSKGPHQMRLKTYLEQRCSSKGTTLQTVSTGIQYSSPRPALPATFTGNVIVSHRIIDALATSMKNGLVTSTQSLDATSKTMNKTGGIGTLSSSHSFGLIAVIMVSVIVTIAITIFGILKYYSLGCYKTNGRKDREHLIK